MNRMIFAALLAISLTSTAYAGFMGESGLPVWLTKLIELGFYWGG